MKKTKQWIESYAYPNNPDHYGVCLCVDLRQQNAGVSIERNASTKFSQRINALKSGLKWFSCNIIKAKGNLQYMYPQLKQNVFLKQKIHQTFGRKFKKLKET